MGELVWDDRLMSREEFWRLAAPLQVRPGMRQGLVFLDCGGCGQAVLPLGTVRNAWTATVEQIAGAVLRHQVAAHNMPLNHRRTNGGAQPGAAARDLQERPAAGSRGRGPGRGGDAAAGRRPADKAAGGRREPGTAGGDRT